MSEPDREPATAAESGSLSAARVSGAEPPPAPPVWNSAAAWAEPPPAPSEAALTAADQGAVSPDAKEVPHERAASASVGASRASAAVSAVPAQAAAANDRFVTAMTPLYARNHEAEPSGLHNPDRCACCIADKVTAEWDALLALVATCEHEHVPKWTSDEAIARAERSEARVAEAERDAQQAHANAARNEADFLKMLNASATEYDRAERAEKALRAIADRHPHAGPGEHPAVDIARAALAGGDTA